jgi:uncharacterized protein (DUF1684 family)
MFDIGGDSANPMVLPGSHMPRVVGTIARTDSMLRFTPARSSHVALEGSTPITTTIDLVSDRSRGSTVIAVGSVRFRVHGEAGTDRLWIRAWDEDHPRRAAFQLPETFPLSAEWRVAARFDSFALARDF